MITDQIRLHALSPMPLLIFRLTKLASRLSRINDFFKTVITLLLLHKEEKEEKVYM